MDWDLPRTPVSAGCSSGSAWSTAYPPRTCSGGPRLRADRALRDEVREQLAEELLVTGGLPVAEVAQRLGYVEVSSFSQAFRRWKGMGPRAWCTQRVGAGGGR